MNSSNGARRENTQKTRDFVCTPQKYTAKYKQLNFYSYEQVDY